MGKFGEKEGDFTCDLMYFVETPLLSLCVIYWGEGEGEGGSVAHSFLPLKSRQTIRASVDALCRDGTSEISRDPRTKRLQTRRESLARPSKHTNNNF